MTFCLGVRYTRVNKRVLALEEYSGRERQVNRVHAVSNRTG